MENNLIFQIGATGLVAMGGCFIIWLATETIKMLIDGTYWLYRKAKKMPTTKRHLYTIVYAGTREGETKTVKGTITYSCKNKPDCFDIDDIAEKIKCKFDLDKVIIQNIIYLGKDWEAIA